MLPIWQGQGQSWASDVTATLTSKKDQEKGGVSLQLIMTREANHFANANHAVYLSDTKIQIMPSDTKVSIPLYKGYVFNS
jgi:hypothetical protein